MAKINNLILCYSSQRVTFQFGRLFQLWPGTSVVSRQRQSDMMNQQKARQVTAQNGSFLLMRDIEEEAAEKKRNQTHPFKKPAKFECGPLCSFAAASSSSSCIKLAQLCSWFEEYFYAARCTLVWDVSIRAVTKLDLYRLNLWLRLELNRTQTRHCSLIWHP